MIIKRIVALAVLALALVAARANAQPAGDKPDASPTAQDLDKAKKAYAEGKRLFDAKKYGDAVDKFKESYRLSKNPLLLYNVGFTLDQKGDHDLALFYYKKFLSDAPADAAQRPDVTARVKDLEAQKPAEPAAVDATKPAGTGDATAPTGTGDATAPTGTGTGDATAPTGTGTGDATGDAGTEPPETHAKPRHPKGTPYTAADFEHVIVDAAPPGKPLDLTAYAPDDAGWQVTLFYRGAGDAKFTAVPMRLRYHELVARIPGSRMSGASVQYYVEVKDRDGGVVTRLGRASSPNLVYLDDSAKPRFYPDLDDSDGTAAAALERTTPPGSGDDHHADETPSGGGIFDPGSKSFERAKWGTTGTAAGLITVSLLFYLVASDAGSTLQGDAARSQSDCGSPPCSTFDADLKTVQSRGQGFETMTNVTLVFGLAATAAAGYFWYEEWQHGQHKQEHASTRSRSFVATPVVGDGFLGGAAALRF